jgi:hypothetical protein
MGCDYYIEKYLYIYYKDKSTDYIKLSTDRGYFYLPDDLDEDDPDFEIKYNELIRLQLKPRMKPLIIYQDNEFITNFLENKYRPIVEQNMKNGKYWIDIEKIIKKESRYERD